MDRAFLVRWISHTALDLGRSNMVTLVLDQHSQLDIAYIFGLLGVLACSICSILDTRFDKQ